MLKNSGELPLRGPWPPVLKKSPWIYNGEKNSNASRGSSTKNLGIEDLKDGENSHAKKGRSGDVSTCQRYFRSWRRRISEEESQKRRLSGKSGPSINGAHRTAGRGPPDWRGVSIFSTFGEERSGRKHQQIRKSGYVKGHENWGKFSHSVEKKW